ncbi:hypothetical protein AUJ65_06205 [Candidatus Micrarchaeota archaeon CG1_02_51_15]|nr:MAG: hypothetical protein AUJ65_06205 [Candidatus Micrarchaeota archaeon CG1_02_51_15]
MAKALVLLSGGLDSLVAAKLLLEQGIEVEGVVFTDPFSGPLEPSERTNAARHAAEQLGIPLTVIDKGKAFFEILENPKHGRGNAFNPCIDCRIYSLKLARNLMAEKNADFIATGEVIGQRPMSQTLGKLRLIERETCLEGKLLRPLSAKALPATEAEETGLVDRKKLWELKGRQRERQIEFARACGLSFPSPAGGCLLTEKGFCKKATELFEHKPFSATDLLFLRVGKHYRLKSGEKAVLGRDKAENEFIARHAEANGALLEPDFPAPTAFVSNCGKKVGNHALKETARLILLNSKGTNGISCNGKEVVASESTDAQRI